METHPSQKTLAASMMLLFIAVAAHGAPRHNQNAASAPDARTASASSPQTAQPPADLGSVSGNLYTNDSLGMAYEFPKGWFVDRAWIEAQNKPVDSGPRPTDPDEAAKYDSMVAMKQGTHALLAVSERGGDTASDSGPRIQLSVSPVFDNKTGGDILTGMKSVYGHMRLIQIEDDPADVTFGGQIFSRMDMRLLDVILRGGAGFQSAIIGVRNGRYLQFLILANSQEQLDSLVHSLDSLRFK
ncbi:MAG TPA: hypothetical protein VEJ46_10230 [Candidatus Acidoferrum sp.]|nr:hypothetical protein [Candidatus Acidoferrum sp.]